MHRVIARSAPPASVDLETDGDLIARFLDDAAHYPGGHADAVARPHTVDDVASVVRQARHVLPVGAQSSLTGGATPAGGIVLSTERLSALRVDGNRVTAGAGVTLHHLQEALRQRGLWLPPVPTYLGATVGGAIATNAAGAATFKYGPMRPWVDRLTIVLAGGDVLELVRGDVTASPDGVFEVHTSEGERRIPVPPIRMPDVPKCSAGYFAAPGMDLIDLFIGSEGTLGVIAEATLRVARRPSGICWVLVPMASEAAALALVGALRGAAHDTWRSRDPHGIDVSAVEHVDRRSLEILREDGADRRTGVVVPERTEVVLLVQVELSEEATRGDLWRDLQSALDLSGGATALGRLCRLLDQHQALEAAEIALPDDTRRAAAFVELREAVPAGVNRRVGLAHARDPRIYKTAGDMIVPYAQFGPLLRSCRDLCARASLDIAVWGHISDGNVHPNVLPQSHDDVARGQQVLLDLAHEVIAMGGSPLAEHGIGRNPIKQQMLRLLHGDAGVKAMRNVKRALDPLGKLAPGVLGFS